MHTVSGRALALALALVPALMTTSGCTKEGCLDGSEGCVVPAPCQALEAPTCEDPSLVLRVIERGDDVPGGLEAFGAIGDVMIGNSRVTAVLDAIENENYIGMSGGFLLDLSTTGDDNDSLNQIVHAVGFLPEDTVVYTSMELLEGDGFVAVQVKGHLAGDIRKRVYSRYEVRPCEPGVRVRTEMYNGGDEDAVWANLDGYWWGGRQNWGFSPVPGIGFNHPAFGLSTVNDAFRDMPFLVGASWVEPAAAYASVGCSVDHLEGFQSDTVSGAGGPREIVRPGDYLLYERIHLAASGRGVEPVAALALDVRERLFREPHTTLSGRVTVAGAAGLNHRERAIVLVSEGRESDPAELRTPWTVVLPEEDGTFTASLPADREYLLEVIAFGAVVATERAQVGTEPVTLDDIDIPAAGELTVSVTAGGQLTDAMVWVIPADDDTATQTAARFLGEASDSCAPLLAYPYGPSPACNRFLVKDPVTVEVPSGSYHVYASIGPFGTVAKEEIVVTPASSEELVFSLEALPVAPAGTLSADFHVHGSKSFDTMLPDVTRVQSLLAARLDVIAATEHDAVGDFSDALDTLGVTDEVILMPGLEATTFVLWNWNPEVTYPQVIGHWNFWPLQHRPDAPKDGAPSDERAEPAQLFTRVKQAELPEWGVIQLNHPFSDNQFGRDYGWADALGLDLNDPLPLYDDGSAAALFHRQPQGSLYRNSDYDTQEVMTGTRNHRVLADRALWFYTLNQGFLRAGTANSDSHTLTDNLVGVPRNLVWTPTTKQDFDVERFNRDVKAGHMIGTNGPVLDVRIVAPSGDVTRPSLAPFASVEGSMLQITLTAAPWVYVDEIRVIVNGEVVRVIEEGIENAASPFAAEPVLRLDEALSLDELLPPGDADAWLVVEAGTPLPLVGDLNCDRIPDTGDNNLDEVVDWRDVDRDEDGAVTDADLDIDVDGVLDDAPTPCTGPVGPILDPEAPPIDSDRHPFYAVSDGAFPLAFTNPFVLDRGGDGYDPPGL